MAWRTQLALVVGLCAAAILAIAGGHRMTTAAIPDRMEEAAAPARSNTAALPESIAEPAAPRRPVASDRIAPPPLESAALERVEPRAPLSEFGQPLIRKRKPVTLLHRPVADAAGRISSGDVTVTLAGLEVVDPERSCVDAAGRSWPCGVRARTAFRAFLRGRAVACDLPQEMAVKQAEVACRLGKIDLGEWLVMSGWAEASAGGPYAALSEKARREGRGIFGSAPALP